MRTGIPVAGALALALTLGILALAGFADPALAALTTVGVAVPPDLMDIGGVLAMSAMGARIERKDDSGTDVKKVVTEVMTAFEEFKSANDARLKELEKKGASDPLITDKLDKLEKSMAKGDDLNQELTTLKGKQQNLETLLKDLETAFARTPRGAGGEGKEDPAATAYKEAFLSVMRSTGQFVDPEAVKALKAAEKDMEAKGLVSGDLTQGGYYLAPAQMATELVKDLVEFSPMRSLASVTSISVKSLILPKRTGTFAARRVGETEPRTETTGYTTGQVEIMAPEMYAEVHISQQMVEDSAFNIEAEMGLEFAEQFAVKEGAEFISGSGAGNEAQGFLNGSGVIETISGDASLITADGLIDLMHAPKSVYMRSGTFVLNRLSLGAARKLKASDGHYLWQPGIAEGRPNTILGAPYVEMPDMPTIAAGAYPVAFGDFRRGYRIADRIGISVLRDPYTLAGTGFIKYLARKRVGGQAVLGQAIAKMKIAAS
ncbi:phage major capsid protein [Salinarimonas sp. NSM]|uniref:phage major capsid protein n=1 Tax=Salinarimonas sp. NSM TaxID=3458003 RepID=UPI0040355C80